MAIGRGASSYRTVCQECGAPAASSYKPSHFYELELAVQGLAGVPEALHALLQEEHLQGDNQYHCEFCDRKVNAAARGGRARPVLRVLGVAGVVAA